MIFARNPILLFDTRFPFIIFKDKTKKKNNAEGTQGPQAVFIHLLPKGRQVRQNQKKSVRHKVQGSHKPITCFPSL